MAPSRGGLTLAERAARSGVDPEKPKEVRPSGAKHCWVTGLPGYPDHCPGLLAEWKTDEKGHWSGRVVYAVEDGDRVILIENWVPAAHLVPVDG